MADQQFKRNIAYKMRVGELLMGTPIISEERFSFLELGDKKIVRVNIVGNIVDKYESNQESKFMSMTLDDGSGQIKLKTFGDDTDKFKNVSQGQTIVVIGVLRHWNNELYAQPEIIKEHNPKYLLIRKLELEKNRSQATPTPEKKAEIIAIKDRLLNEIKKSEDQGGIERDTIIMNLRDTSPQMINQEIQKLLEEGIIFEPRPGKVRYLG